MLVGSATNYFYYNQWYDDTEWNSESKNKNTPPSSPNYNSSLSIPYTPKLSIHNISIHQIK